MSQPIKKQQIIGLFGEKAGTKLLNWLDPCCEQFCLDVRNCGGGSLLTFDNGLTLTGNNIQLGGSLVANTIIDVETFSLNIGSSSGGGSISYDGTTDTIELNGSFINTFGPITSQGNILPIGLNTYDLGNSGQTWRDIYLSRNAILTGLTTYANDAAADADGALPSGGLYKLTGNRTIFQKP